MKKMARGTPAGSVLDQIFHIRAAILQVAPEIRREYVVDLLIVDVALPRVVRRDDHVGFAPQRVVRRQGLDVEDVQIGMREPFRVERGERKFDRRRGDRAAAVRREIRGECPSSAADASSCSGSPRSGRSTCAGRTGRGTGRSS